MFTVISLQLREHPIEGECWLSIDLRVALWMDYRCFVNKPHLKTVGDLCLLQTTCTLTSTTLPQNIQCLTCTLYLQQLCSGIGAGAGNNTKLLFINMGNNTFTLADGKMYDENVPRMFGRQ